MRVLFTLVALIVGVASSQAAIKDSVGVKKVNNKTYIVHKVEVGETLYAISRRYGVSIADISAANNVQATQLGQGQEILIPYKGKIEETTAQHHTVKAGETLFGIAQKYKVSVNEITEWSDLESNALEIGQTLTVSKPIPVEKEQQQLTHKVAPSETLYSISRKYKTSAELLQKLNKMDNPTIKVGQVLIVREGVVPVKKNSFEKHTGVTKVSLMSDGKYLDSKYAYCLHPSLPQGSIVKLENRGTDNFIYARVMGYAPSFQANLTVMKTLSPSLTEFDANIVFFE